MQHAHVLFSAPVAMTICGMELRALGASRGVVLAGEGHSAAGALASGPAGLLL
jgi:hypothetical protein